MENNMEKQKTRILLVEDDKTDREAVERFVTQQNLPYNLYTAQNKKEVLEKIGVAHG